MGLPYRIAASGDWGRYLVATREIERGELILEDVPLVFCGSRDEEEELKPELLDATARIGTELGTGAAILQRFTALVLAFAHASDAARSKVLDLYCPDPRPPSSWISAMRDQKSPVPADAIADGDGELAHQRAVAFGVARTLAAHEADGAPAPEVTWKVCMIALNNSWQYGAGDGMAVFELLSMPAHSCSAARVNALYVSPRAGGGRPSRLIARRAIKENESICLSYLRISELTVSTSFRRRLLRTHRQFDCACELCTSPADALRALPCAACAAHARAPVTGFLPPADELGDLAFMLPHRVDGDGGCEWRCESCGGRFQDAGAAKFGDVAPGCCKAVAIACRALKLPDFGVDAAAGAGDAETLASEFCFHLDQALEDCAFSVPDMRTAAKAARTIARVLGPNHWATWKLMEIVDLKLEACKCDMLVDVQDAKQYAIMCRMDASVRASEATLEGMTAFLKRASSWLQRTMGYSVPDADLVLEGNVLMALEALVALVSASEIVQMDTEGARRVLDVARTLTEPLQQWAALRVGPGEGAKELYGSKEHSDLLESALMWIEDQAAILKVQDDVKSLGL